ncbi:MAG: hypothetical protein PHI28_04590 [Mangrovibacterium sp.]|nr:hypothetical protein [Mangrovibacterium sp.]
MNPAITRKEYKNVLNNLVAKKLVTFGYDDTYDVSLLLKIELFPRLVIQSKYNRIIKSSQNRLRSLYYQPIEYHIRNYLFSEFVKDHVFLEDTIEYLEVNLNAAVAIFDEMLAFRVYDRALMRSIKLFSRLMDIVHNNNTVYFRGYDKMIRFYNRNPQFEGLHHQVENQLAEMIFQGGHLIHAYESVEFIDNKEALLLKAQVELFRGNFALSVANFEKARSIGEEGVRVSRGELSYYHEFFYWLNFIFWPEGLNLKKLDNFVNRAEKSQNSNHKVLLPLLYMVKKDKTQAETQLIWLDKNLPEAYPSVRSFFFFLMDYDP